MIKNLLFTLLLLFSLGAIGTAQTYSDDFEGYSAGQYIGNESATWSTWSGATGGAEDALIVDTKAKSGSNSIYFYSTDQGPQDVLLLFGDKYTTGTFDLKFSIFISEGGEAYWNFQQELMAGTTWAGNAWYREGGMMTIDAGGQVMQTPFVENAWNDVEYNIDLDNGEWIIKINDQCVGTLLAPASVSSLDIYPLTENTGLSEFWIDDVNYTHSETSVEKTVDVALTNVAADGAAFTDEKATVNCILTNTGETNVGSVDLYFSANGGSGEIKTVEANLEPGENMVVSFVDGLNTLQGSNLIEMGVSEIDGLSSDDVPCNNAFVTAISGITPTPNKRVVVEEATGTWCPWCVRGTVFMARMEEKYKERFVGIAVHNDDPMMVDDYDAWMAAYPGFGGYPDAVVERNSVIDPSGIEAPIVGRLQQPINETFQISVNYDEDLNELIAHVTVDAINKLTSTRRLVVVLTEDNVTGTGFGYAQANAYAIGSGNGEMGGYENLPSPVPASQMEYDEVARALLTPANGMALGETIEAGESMTFTVGAELNPEIDLNNLNIIAFIAAPPPTRVIDNAMKVKFNDALTSDNKELELDFDLTVMPNPVRDITYIKMDIAEAASTSMEIYSVTGQLVMSRDYGMVQGDIVFTVNATNLANGVYNVVMSVDGKKSNKKIVVSH